MRGLLLLALILGACLLPPPAAALTDPAPELAQWVEGALLIEQPDLTTLNISAEFVLRKYVVTGTPYSSSDDIANAYLQLVSADEFAKTNGAASDRAAKFIADMEDNATRALRDTLERSFPGATIQVPGAFLDPAQLTPPSGDPFEPGVAILMAATVERTPAQVGLANFSDDAIAAVFAAGGIVETTFTLTAESGHDLTYSVLPPTSIPDLTFGEVGPAPTVTLEGGAAIARIDNKDGPTTKSLEARVTLLLPTAVANSPVAEAITIQANVTMSEFQGGARDVPLDIDVDVAIGAFSVAQRLPAGTLPAAVKLSFLSADALRALTSAGAISDAQLVDAEANLRAKIATTLGGTIPGATVTGGFDRTDLRAATPPTFALDPPVHFLANASGNHAGPEGTQNADLAIRIGANLTFELPLPRSDMGDLALTIVPPTTTRILFASDGSVADDGSSVTMSVPRGDSAAGSPPVAIGMRGRAAPEYTDAQIANGTQFGAVIDLRDVQLGLTGDGAILGEVRIALDIGLLDFPAEFATAVPTTVEIDHLTSDALRLLYERKLITREQLATIERAFLENITTQLRTSLGDIDVSGGLDEASLDPTLVRDPVSGERPITLRASATFSQPLSGSATPDAQPALALKTITRSFALPRVQGLPTTYTVILPRGIDIASVDAQGGVTSAGQAPDGRAQFTVRPSSDQATATVAMAITPTFVFTKFWPVLLLAFVVLAALVGGGVALVRAKRRTPPPQS